MNLTNIKIKKTLNPSTQQQVEWPISAHSSVQLKRSRRQPLCRRRAIFLAGCRVADLHHHNWKKHVFL